jgi:hypothetical protein
MIETTTPTMEGMPSVEYDGLVVRQISGGSSHG